MNPGHRLLLVCVLGGFLLGLFVGSVWRPAPDMGEVQRLRAQAHGWHLVASQMQTRVDTQVVVQVKRDVVVRRITDSILVNLAENRPECQPVVDACAERIAAERAEAGNWRVLFEDEKEVADGFRRAADTAIHAVDVAVKPRSLWASLIRPELRPGIGAGYCWTLDGRQGPCVNAGLSLVWRF